jgi:hypothetical protein
MYENMVGPVGFGMSEDRLAQAKKNMRLAETQRGERAVARGGYRQAVALALKALAARIAPPETTAGGYTRAMGR